MVLGATTLVNACWIRSHHALVDMHWSTHTATHRPQVLRGYAGDRSKPPVFSGSNPFDILGRDYQRPFELATLRLYNMQAVLTNCTESTVWRSL